MLQNDSLEHLKQRADKIGLTLKVLAREAGMDASRLYRNTKPGADYKRSTADRAVAVLARHEKEILIHLAKLYPALAIQAARGDASLPDSRQADIEDMIGRAAG